MDELRLAGPEGAVPPLPTFLIIGAPKAATTTVFMALRGHPSVFMSPIKETSFFLTGEVSGPPSPARTWRSRDEGARGSASSLTGRAEVTSWDHYVSLFAGAKEALAVGEATPQYLDSSLAPGAIAERLPHVKLVALLRDPADRAYSTYCHYLRAGHVTRSFGAVLQRELDGSDSLEKGWDRFLRPGRYFENLSRYLGRFPRERLWIGFFDDLIVDPGRFFKSLCDFLSVPPFGDGVPRESRNVAAVPRFPRAHRIFRLLGVPVGHRGIFNTGSTPRGLALAYWRSGPRPIPPSDRRLIQVTLGDDIRRLEGLVDRDLSDWLAP